MLMGCSSGKDESQAVKQEAEKSEAAVDDALNVVILINGNLGIKHSMILRQMAEK